MQKLPQFVVKRLQGTLPDAESHPDPDLLTAYAEQSLASRERAYVVGHIAHCGDCRDVIAIASAAEESASDASASSIQLARVPWFSRKVFSRTVFSWTMFSWTMFRWGAVAAGILIVVSVGLLQYGNRRHSTIVASDSLRGDAAPIGSTRPLPALAVPAPENENLENAPNKPRLPIAGRKPGMQENRPQLSGIGSEPAAVEAQSKPEVSSTAGVSAAENQLAQNQLAQNQLAQNHLDLPPHSVAPTSFNVVKAKDPVPSPVGALWTVNNGRLRRSDNGGRTWEEVKPSDSLLGIDGGIEEPQGSQTQADTQKADAARLPRFLAVIEIGPEIWAGGSGSSLYHSVDGGDHWAPVSPSAAGAVLTGDITGIQFSDQQDGRITTSTSELWITSDAGQTWLKQQ